MRRYLQDVFSNSNCASFARYATLVTVVTGCWAVVHLVRANNALPGPADLVALAAWMTAPYAINKTAAVLTPTQNPD